MIKTIPLSYLNKYCLEILLEMLLTRFSGLFGFTLRLKMLLTRFSGLFGFTLFLDMLLT